jgi:hypothetical protein
MRRLYKICQLVYGNGHCRSVVYALQLNTTLGRAQSARLQLDIDIIIIAAFVVEIYPLVISDRLVGWPHAYIGHLPIDYVSEHHVT